MGWLKTVSACETRLCASR